MHWHSIFFHLRYQIQKLFEYLILQSRILSLLCKHVVGAVILPLLSISLSFWNESSDFIVAVNAMTDGEWFLGILIGIIPFWLPSLYWILLGNSSTLKDFYRTMNVTKYETFPFLQILGHLKARYQLLHPRKELYLIEKQLLTCSRSEERKILIQQKALVQSKMVWPVRKLSYYKYFEGLESSIESILQCFLLFRKTQEIKNILPFLERDYLKNGLFGSLLCSLLSSEFSFIYFTLNKVMAEPFLNQTPTLLPSMNIGFVTVFKLSIVDVVLKLSRLAVAVVCMNGLPFIIIYYLLHRTFNHFWFSNHRHLAITGTFFSIKGMYPIEDPNTNRTFYRSLLLAGLETIMLWILALISKFFGYLIKPEIGESPGMLMVFSIILLANPFGLYLQVYTFRRNNIFAACACGDVDTLLQMMDRPIINFNAVDQYHRTGFIIACQYGQTEVVEFLLRNAKRRDIDLNWRADNELTGFHIACIRGHYEIVSLIIQHANGLCINLFQKDSEGQTAFEMWPEIFTETDYEIHLKQF